MKILYASVNIYHHMIPLSKAIVNSVGSNSFKYAVLQPKEEFRIRMGFDSDNEHEKWVISAYKNEKNHLEFVKWFYEADVVLFSDRTLFKMANERINANKLTFYFSERWWKPPIGEWRLLHPKYLYFAITLRSLSKNSNIHYLAQGAYAAKDLSSITKFENRIWNWGYFTDITENTSVTKSIIKKDDSKINILWCGRFLKWKRVDTLIRAYALTIKDYPQCHLTLIGEGIEKRRLERLADKLLPDWSYDFIPAQPPKIIREAMNRSDIFVLSSNGYEGWGAVLNEAMAEGCAVIASIESGGAKALISDMKNGILFSSGNYHQLRDKLSIIINDKELMLELKARGKETVNYLWSPAVAADRFLKVCHALLSNTYVPVYKLGPMKSNNNSI
jgi:glycosyltransferase involved in cell wall biosynthesis